MSLDNQKAKDLYYSKEALRVIALEAKNIRYKNEDDYLLGELPSKIDFEVKRNIEKYRKMIGNFLIKSPQDCWDIYNEYYKLYKVDAINSSEHAEKIIKEQISIQHKKYEKRKITKSG